MQFITSSNNKETYVALTQQEYLTNNPKSFVNKSLSDLFYNYRNFQFDTDTQKVKIQIFYKNGYNYKILYNGDFDKLPDIYKCLQILPWSEEIPVHLKPLTIYLLVNYNKSTVDHLKDMLDRGFNEEQEERNKDRFFVRFSRELTKQNSKRKERTYHYAF